MSYGQKEFKGTDWSSPTRKNTVSDHGGVELGWNHNDGEFGEILVVVNQPKGNIPMVVLDKDGALAMLTHLNDLLGNPLSHPATAGGSAPSAD